MKGLYKYPQAEFPYARLVEENRRRGRRDPEFELVDTGMFDEDRYFDVVAEYAKATPDDLLIRITVTNRGPDPAPLHLLPTLWCRNTWAWEADASPAAAPSGAGGERGVVRPRRAPRPGRRTASTPRARPSSSSPRTRPNRRRLYGVENETPFVKDAFHEAVVRGESARSTRPRRARRRRPTTG